VKKTLDHYVSVKITRSSEKSLGGRGDHGAGVPEWTPEGVYDFC